MTIEENKQEENKKLANIICDDFFECMKKYDVELQDAIYIAGTAMRTECMMMFENEGLEFSEAKEIFNIILENTKIR